MQQLRFAPSPRPPRSIPSVALDFTQNCHALVGVGVTSGSQPCSDEAAGLRSLGLNTAYWVKNAPLPVSLVTGDPANPTHELLNSDQNFGMFSGVRIGLGMWFDSANTVGMESSFFSLFQLLAEFILLFRCQWQPGPGLPVYQSNPGRRRL